MAKSSLRPLTIEDEIAKLQALLPPIDYEAAAHAQFNEFSTYDEHGDLVECTCTFREVITYADELETTPINGFEEQQATVNNNSGSSNNIKINGDNNKPEDSDDDDETDDFCAVEDVDEIKKLRSPSPPPLKRSAVKSIFDPEYDANENLIEEMVRQKPRNNVMPKIIEVKFEKNAVKSARIESMLTAAVPEPQAQIERVPIINYECDEDPECPAHEHFRQEPVKQRDIERLHTTFIDGVNGYWNGIVEERSEHDYTRDSESIDYVKNRLWKRVVPRYNFLTLDKLPKTFDDDSPFSIPPPPPPPDEQANDKPVDDDKIGDDKKKKSLNDTKCELENGNNFSLTKHRDMEFREWHEVMNVRSYNDEVLTILPYVVID